MTFSVLPTPGQDQPVHDLPTLRALKDHIIMTTIRHKLITTNAGGAACDCGYDPRIVLGTEFDWIDAARAVVAHIKQSRRWKYLGCEFWFGTAYYIWENQLSKRRAAIPEHEYLRLTGVSRNPRLQVGWSSVTGWTA